MVKIAILASLVLALFAGSATEARAANVSDGQCVVLLSQNCYHIGSVTACIKYYRDVCTGQEWSTG